VPAHPAGLAAAWLPEASAASKSYIANVGSSSLENDQSNISMASGLNWDMRGIDSEAIESNSCLSRNRNFAKAHAEFASSSVLNSMPPSVNLRSAAADIDASSGTSGTDCLEKAHAILAKACGLKEVILGIAAAEIAFSKSSLGNYLSVEKAQAVLARCCASNYVIFRIAAADRESRRGTL